MWRKARAEDYAEAARFVREYETSSPYLAARLASGRLPEDGLFLVRGEPIEGAVFLSDAGLLAPLLGEAGPRLDAEGELSGREGAMADILGLAAFFQETRASVATAMGSGADLDAIGLVLGRLPFARQSYLVMSRAPGRPRPAGAQPRGAPQAELVRPRELPALLGLQRAFEEAELFQTGEPFDGEEALGRLERRAAEGDLFALEGEGGYLAKGEIDARCFGHWLIGGLVVEPAWRGRGLGRAMMEALCAPAFEAGKAALLIVRPENEAALRLYASLDFARVPRPEEFRIAWYR
jgi:ribosomal protein S18 acetylase RimI-like enzyme